MRTPVMCRSGTSSELFSAQSLSAPCTSSLSLSSTTAISTIRLLVTSLAGQQIDRVRQNVDDCFERLHRRTGLPGRFEDEGLPPNAAEAAAQDGERRVRQTRSPHLLRDALDEAGRTPRASPRA